jgi:phosphoribosyl-AMP cyclohydrolase
MTAPPTLFPPPGSKSEVEAGTNFTPRFDTDGLIPAIVTDAADGTVLMFAWMNAEALALSLETRIAHFWTRSRRKIWRKGEESGNLLHIAEIKVDCDQDVLLIRATLGGAGKACHTGVRSCFYRTVGSRQDGGSGFNLSFDASTMPAKD